MNNQDSLRIEELGKSSSKRKLNKRLLIKLFFLFIFFYYLYSLFFGESSIGVLQDAKERKERLKSEYHKLQNENQKLQKKHFELIQLTPDEDSF